MSFTGFIKSWQFMAIIVGILAAAAIGSVVYGVATHTEPGFSDEFRALHFENDLRPLPVCVTGYSAEHDGPEPHDQATATADELGQVEAATQQINDRVGLRLLTSGSPEATPCVIHVQIGVPIDDTWSDPGGRAWPCTSSACCIQTANTGGVEMTGLVLQHELGHCLGLADDCFLSSIMCGGHCCEMRPAEPGTYPPRMTDSDRALLRSLYTGEEQ